MLTRELVQCFKVRASRPLGPADAQPASSSDRGAAWGRAARRRRCRPAVEHLEDHVLLSAAGVMGTADLAPAAAVATMTTLSIAPLAAYQTQPVVLSATVAASQGGSTPSGTVDFEEGGSVLGSAMLDPGGQAAFTTSTLALGDHSITAVYAGNTDFQGSMSVAQDVYIYAQYTTTTTLTANFNPAIANLPLLFTASVALTSTVVGGTPYGGLVTFEDGSSVLGSAMLSTLGQATFTTSALTLGPHAITAVYGGSDAFLGSTSAALPVTIIAPPPAPLATTTTLVSSANPASVLGGATLTATVANGRMGQITGTVSFYNGPTLMETVPVDEFGNATDFLGFEPPVPARGTYAFTARYSGDTYNQPSQSPVLTQVINGLTSATNLSASTTSSTYGQPITFTALAVWAPPPDPAAQTSGIGADVTPFPTGPVTLFDDGTPLVTLQNGEETTFTISTLAAGVHTITASYAGDATFDPSMAAIANLVISRAAPTVSVNAVVTPSAPTPGETAGLTADVTGPAGVPPPTGTVTFLDGSTVLGTAPLNSSGVATFATSTLGAGVHAITVSYSGDPDFLPGTASSVNVAVGTGDGPRVVGLQRFGYHAQPTILVVRFDSALAPAPAQDVSNYRIVTLGGRGRGGALVGHITRVREAVYHPSTMTVTLDLAARLDVHNRYQLTVNGTVPYGLTGASGLPLDGQANDDIGTDYVAVLSRAALAGPASGTPPQPARS